jgi:hypothetical protein
MFVGDPTVTILGVADVNAWAPGLELARRLNIPVTTDLRGLIVDPRLDLVIDVTGSPEVQRTILELKPAATEVMGGASARFMWDLLAERKRSEELEDRYSLMLRELQAQAEGDFIIGQNPKMKDVAQLIVRVAATPTTVLILGESGTGKELVARAIHRYLNLRDKPLIAVNCTALAPTLLESELFDHKRGAFTGAVADKPGLFETADGGTIFLDEVGDMRLRCRAGSCACCRPGRASPWATSSRAKCASASSPRPTGCSRRRSPRASSARTCSAGSTRSRSRCRRCGSGPMTSPFWPPLPAEGRGQGQQEGGPPRSRGARSPQAVPVAREPGRTGEHHRARRGAGDRPADRGRAATAPSPGERPGPHAGRNCPARC